MNYTGFSCANIHDNNPETSSKNGYYYRIIDDHWIFCNMTAITAGFYCAGFGGEWRKIASFNTIWCMLEMTVPQNGVRVFMKV